MLRVVPSAGSGSDPSSTGRDVPPRVLGTCRLRADLPPVDRIVVRCDGVTIVVGRRFVAALRSRRWPWLADDERHRLVGGLMAQVAEVRARLDAAGLDAVPVRGEVRAVPRRARPSARVTVAAPVLDRTGVDWVARLLSAVDPAADRAAFGPLL
jgi:hypothetical protein